MDYYVCSSPSWVLIQLGFGLLFRIKYWICFFKVDCMSFFGQDAKKNENFRFFAVSGKVKTNIWINIDLRKQLDSWEIFDIFWFEKTNIQIYPIFQMIFNRQKLIVLCVCLAVVRFFYVDAPCLVTRCENRSFNYNHEIFKTRPKFPISTVTAEFELESIEKRNDQILK